ncbi:MAG: DUF551 domain-containing protein [Clostridia bacterium]|nr:DUF551 domain-containing protein [Clostridia bacterium]
MNWISVLERLPKIENRYFKSIECEIMASEPVLVSKDGNCVMYGYFEETENGIVFWHVAEDDYVLEDYDYMLDEISHWMPLPAPAELSNEEWFKRALVEGVNIHFQRIIDSCEE